MQIESKIVNIPYINNVSTEYVEDELKKLGINPLRWAIVKADDKNFTISCAFEG